jgi:hypothetical protein
MTVLPLSQSARCGRDRGGGRHYFFVFAMLVIAAPAVFGRRLSST